MRMPASALTRVYVWAAPVTIGVQVAPQRQNVVAVEVVSVHVPGVAVTVWPTLAVPLRAGIGLAAGGAGLIAGLAAEVAATLASRLLAVTIARSVAPVSAAVSW